MKPGASLQEQEAPDPAIARQANGNATTFGAGLPKKVTLHLSFAMGTDRKGDLILLFISEERKRVPESISSSSSPVPLKPPDEAAL